MIDWNRVCALRDDIGADAFSEVVEIFLEEVQEVVDKLATAQARGSLEHDLHALKNAALNLGFVELSKLCQMGESAASRELAHTVDTGQIVTVYETSRGAFLEDLSERT